jgi:hypothetical protein
VARIKGSLRVLGKKHKLVNAITIRKLTRRSAVPKEIEAAQ